MPQLVNKLKKKYSIQYYFYIRVLLLQSHTLPSSSSSFFFLIIIKKYHPIFIILGKSQVSFQSFVFSRFFFRFFSLWLKISPQRGSSRQKNIWKFRLVHGVFAFSSGAMKWSIKDFLLYFTRRYFLIIILLFYLFFDFQRGYDTTKQSKFILTEINGYYKSNDRWKFILFFD